MKLIDITKVRKHELKKLAAAGITDIASLIAADVGQLAEATGIEADTIAAWQQTAVEMVTAVEPEKDVRVQTVAGPVEYLLTRKRPYGGD